MRGWKTCASSSYLSTLLRHNNWLPVTSLHLEREHLNVSECARNKRHRSTKDLLCFDVQRESEDVVVGIKDSGDILLYRTSLAGTYHVASCKNLSDLKFVENTLLACNKSGTLIKVGYPVEGGDTDTVRNNALSHIGNVSIPLHKPNAPQEINHSKGSIVCLRSFYSCHLFDVEAGKEVESVHHLQSSTRAVCSPYEDPRHLILGTQSISQIGTVEVIDFRSGSSSAVLSFSTRSRNITRVVVPPHHNHTILTAHTHSGRIQVFDIRKASHKAGNLDEVHAYLCGQYADLALSDARDDLVCIADMGERFSNKCNIKVCELSRNCFPCIGRSSRMQLTVPPLDDSFRYYYAHTVLSLFHPFSPSFTLSNAVTLSRSQLSRGVVFTTNCIVFAETESIISFLKKTKYI
jgi:hypothetical protein